MMNGLTYPDENSLLRWRINLEEADNNSAEEVEEENDGTVLRTFVRTNYLSSLRKCLRKNLEAKKHRGEAGTEDMNVNKIVKGCSALLEELALRNCMVTKLYQQKMNQIIKEVNKSTFDGTVYSPLKDFWERQNEILIPVDHKEIQTELTMDFLENLLSNSYLSTHKHGHKAYPVTGAGDCDPLDFKGRDTSDIPDLNGILETYAARKRLRSDKIDDGDSNAADNSEKYVQFDARLNDPLFCEAVSCWFNFETETDRLPPVKRRKLNEKFLLLFGMNHAVDYFDLSPEQKSLSCRKRIAKFVVFELTNFYSQKKIASKVLFKTMAKHITSSLLEKSLYPDPAVIKKCVASFFANGRVVNKDDDFLT